ncbi:MAG: hypothetical protein LBD58_10775 [Treponema sp.]|nr:hypothetical protein [Treponema sp.]
MQVRPGHKFAALDSVWWKPISQANFRLGNIWGGGGMYTAGVASADDVILNSDKGIITFRGRGHKWSGYRAVRAWGMDIDRLRRRRWPVSCGQSSYFIAAAPFNETNVDGSGSIDNLTAGEEYANTAFIRVKRAVQQKGAAVFFHGRFPASFTPPQAPPAQRRNRWAAA